MQKSCVKCAQKFEITDEDLKFYDKVSPVFADKKYLIPPPTLCPDCRLQLRLAFRNERKLYIGRCDMSGKEIISMYAPGKKFKVYDQNEWWSDKWDPLSYGMEFDFRRPFKEQFRQLYSEVPHVSLYNNMAENSYYTNFTLKIKNSYLIYGGANNQDCLYGKFITGCKDCVDSLSLYNCELCYEVSASENCYNCKFVTNCRNCVDCFMIQDCQACKNCIACFGLRKKEYYILNKFVGKEEYEKINYQLNDLSRQDIEIYRSKLNALKAKLPHIQAHLYSCDNCTGDMVFNSRNCFNAFDSKECEDCKYIAFTPKGISSQDCTFNSPAGVEFCYLTCSTVGVRESMGTFLLWFGNRNFYSMECHNCNDLFGCVGLRGKKHCIFNKQYAPEEYEQKVAEIIHHMQITGEWGEYFDISCSPFAYNETIANEYYPLSKEAAIKLGAVWKDEDQINLYQGEIIKIPENIKTITDDFTKKILTCTSCSKNYRIIDQELRYYRKNNLPVPAFCPDCRHRARLALRNPLKLWSRSCAKCKEPIQTSYAPDRPEIVYCESCYLKEVY
jgi:uncharacterized protein YbaR (Trm112 family)